MSKARLFKGVWAQPGSKLMELLEANPPRQRDAERLVKYAEQMYDACYDIEVVQKVRYNNPDLF